MPDGLELRQRLLPKLSGLASVPSVGGNARQAIVGQTNDDRIGLREILARAHFVKQFKGRVHLLILEMDAAPFRQYIADISQSTNTPSEIKAFLEADICFFVRSREPGAEHEAQV